MGKCELLWGEHNQIAKGQRNEILEVGIEVRKGDCTAIVQRWKNDPEAAESHFRTDSGEKIIKCVSFSLAAGINAVITGGEFDIVGNQWCLHPLEDVRSPIDPMLEAFAVLSVHRQAFNCGHLIRSRRGDEDSLRADWCGKVSPPGIGG